MKERDNEKVSVRHPPPVQELINRQSSAKIWTMALFDGPWADGHELHTGQRTPWWAVALTTFAALAVGLAGVAAVMSREGGLMLLAAWVVAVAVAIVLLDGYLVRR